ncbi:thioredoxin family protein [Vibrio sp. HN007]|uniref:thioredoxin family protein n=1 Tax=Vibrio iocasae TaxID=3098914 RepID=UPI0035D52AE6
MLLDTPICDFGWKAPNFALPDPDGNIHTLSKSIGENGLVIAFISNHCPYVQAIAERLAMDSNELKAEGINFLAIMSNDYNAYLEDSPIYMKQFSQHYGFNFPYLVDQEQVVARSFGAVCTPDFFGFNKRGELQYRGRLDDARMQSLPNRTKELVIAMTQIAKTDRGPENQFASMGCSIKWR